MLIGAASDRNVGEMVGLLNEYFWANTRDMAGKGRSALLFFVAIVAGLAAANKTLLGRFSRAFRFVEHGLVKVKQKKLLT